jgi:phage-related minor tail protein
MLNAHRQFAKNLGSRRDDLAKARAKAPKKHNGYTVAQIERHIRQLEIFVAYTDDEMREHLANTTSAEGRLKNAAKVDAILADDAEREASLARVLGRYRAARAAVARLEA